MVHINIPEPVGVAIVNVVAVDIALKKALASCPFASVLLNTNTAGETRNPKNPFPGSFVSGMFFSMKTNSGGEELPPVMYRVAANCRPLHDGVDSVDVEGEIVCPSWDERRIAD
jgi:hypothetical protein